jgi:hypothetical protein
LIGAGKARYNCSSHRPSWTIRKAEVANMPCHADRETWAHFTDRDRFLSPQWVSSQSHKTGLTSAAAQACSQPSRTLASASSDFLCSIIPGLYHPFHPERSSSSRLSCGEFKSHPQPQSNSHLFQPYNTLLSSLSL